MITQIITDIGGGYSPSNLNNNKSIKDIKLINDAISFCAQYVEHVYDCQIKEVYINSRSIKIELKDYSLKNIFSKKITFEDIYEDLRKFIKNSRKFKNNILISAKDNEIFFKYEESNKVNLSNKLSDF